MIAIIDGAEIVWPLPMGRGVSSYAASLSSGRTKASRGTARNASRTLASRTYPEATRRSTIRPRARAKKWLSRPTRPRTVGARHKRCSHARMARFAIELCPPQAVRKISHYTYIPSLNSRILRPPLTGCGRGTDRLCDRGDNSNAYPWSPGNRCPRAAFGLPRRRGRLSAPHRPRPVVPDHGAGESVRTADLRGLSHRHVDRCERDQSSPHRGERA